MGLGAQQTPAEEAAQTATSTADSNTDSYTDNGTDTEAGSNIAVNLAAAIAIGVLQLGVAISLAALIFSGSLNDGAGRASAGFVIGTGIVSAIVGLRSTMPIVIAGAQDTAAIVIAAVAASIAAAAPTDAVAVSTVMVMIAVSALLTAIAFLIISRFGWTSFVRFLPWPVITGFAAGTGWLLLWGGLEVMGGHGLDLASFGDWATLRMLLPGIGLALLIQLVLASPIPNWVVSALILIGALLFHVVGRQISSAARMEEDGWLVGPFPADISWKPISPADFSAADLGVLVDHTLPIITIVAVSIVGLLLNLSGLEPILDADIELDTEVSSAGLANVAVAATGGLIGYHLIGDTTLARQLSARGRLVPITIAVMSLMLFVAGPDLIGLMPRAVAGGVLAGVGLNLLVQWVATTLPTLTTTDRLLSGGILASIAVLGVLPGVGIGTLVAMTIFVVNYSRTDPVRFVLGVAGRSNVDRSWRQRALLADQRGAIVAVPLHGYLFFGSVQRVRATVEACIDQSDQRPQFLILDFSRVSGIDSTAASGIASLIANLDADVTPVLAQPPDTILAELKLVAEGQVTITSHADLDHAIAACEELLIAELPVERASSLPPMSNEIHAAFEYETYAPGEKVIRAGDLDRDLYFVQSGNLTAWVTLDDEAPARLRQIQPGAVVGEVAFCTGSPRTADVIADTDVELQVLRRKAFDDLRKNNPAVALELQELLATRLADRLSATSAMVRHLMH